MSNEERVVATEAGLKAHAEKLEKYHGTPILCIGIGRDPGPMKGKFIVSLAGGLPPEEAYQIVTAMQDDLARQIGVA